MKTASVSDPRGLRVALCLILAAAPQIFAAATAVPVDVPEKIQVGRAIVSDIGPGRVRAYRIPAAAGGFVRGAVDQRGIDLVVKIFAPDGSAIGEVDSPNGDNGPEPIAFQAAAGGDYRIEIASLSADARAGGYRLIVDEVLSASQYAQRLAQQAAQRKTVVRWLAGRAIPVRTLQAENGFDDLRPFAAPLKDVRIVGLGEATHGTHEFFAFKHRMIEYLVKEMGYRVVAMELDAIASEKIDDYIAGRSDDRSQFVLKPWDTEEVLATIEWLRRYNAAAGERGKVRFVGIDGQDPLAGKDELLAYLQRTAPDYAVKTALFFKDEVFPTKLAPDKARELRMQYADLLAFLELDGIRLIGRSSSAEYERARRIARALAQSRYIFDPDATNAESLARRDAYMADNLKRLLDGEAGGAKAILYAHNGHVGIDDSGFKRVGAHLREWMGPGYYALGFAFYQGGFQAWDAKIAANSGRWVIKPYTAAALPADSLDAYFAETGLPRFLVDFRTESSEPAVSAWLGEAHPSLMFGASYDPARGGDRFRAIPGKTFDGMFFVKDATRALPSERMSARYKE